MVKFIKYLIRGSVLIFTAILLCVAIFSLWRLILSIIIYGLIILIIFWALDGLI